MRTTLHLLWILIVASLIPVLSWAEQGTSGLIAEEVASDSTAAKAGLRPGDRIVSYDNRQLSSPAVLEAAQDNTFGRQEVVLAVRRGEDLFKVTVPLGALGVQARPELSRDVGSLYEQGKTALKAKATNEAIAKWEAAAKSAQQEGDKTAAAWLYGRIGEIRQIDQRWKEAGESYLTAWGLLKQGGDKAAQSKVLRALGDTNRISNNFAAAQNWFEQSRQLDLAAGDEMWVTRDLNGLGLVARDRGNLQAAQDYLSRALSIEERLPSDSLDVAASLNDLGSVADERGDLQAAQDYLSRALSIEERLAPDSLDVAASLNNLGSVADERGDLQVAQDYLSRALSIKQRLVPDSLDVAKSLNNLGSVADERGDLQAAQNYFSRALSIKERLAPDSLALAYSLTSLGQVASERGDQQAAQDYHSRALSIREHLAPDSLDVANSLNNLGVVAYYRGDQQAAQDYYSRALSIRERLAPDSLDIAESLTNLGKINRGNPQAARDLLSHALSIQERLAPNSLQAANILTGLGDAALQDKHFQDAKLSFSRAIGIVESQRSQIATAEDRALLLALHTEPYIGLVRTYLALNDPPSAFLTSERAHARSLLELLTEARADIRQGVEPSLLERERSLQQSLNAKAAYQTRLLSGKHTAEQAAAAAKEIDALTVEYHDIEAKIRATSPHYATLTQPRPLSLEEVQKQVLDKDTLLLEYALGEQASYVFAVSQASIRSYSLPKRGEIESLGRQVYETLTARNRHKAGETAAQRESRIAQAGANYPKLGAELSQMVLAPAAADFGHKRLLIVGDGILLQIPFAALRDPAANQSQPLIIAHEIVSLPSASVVAEQGRELAERKAAPKQVAVFADPVFEPNDERVKARANLAGSKVNISPAESAPRDFERAIGEAGLSTDRSSISRLLFSRREADAIFALTRSSAGLEAVGFDANKEAATSSELGNYRIVHFATHGLLNGDHPELSSIVLSLIDRQGHYVDGFLRLNEIYNLHLPAELVVLSACQTGLGRQIKGEGLIGLVRGFMYAGAPRVVAGLWKVDDAATADLMARFYKKMLKGNETVPAALQHAQIEMSHEKRWSSPYFWAGFEMQGEWRAMK